MLVLILVTISNAIYTPHVGHTESASSLVRHREQEAQMTLPEALEQIQYNKEIPKEVMSLLKPKRRMLRKAQVSLLQGKQAPDAATLEKLDKARLVLNKMYEEEQKELDIIIWDCRTYIATQMALMAENVRLKVGLAAEVARAKGENLKATATMKKAELELGVLNDDKTRHEAACKKTLDAARGREAILASDYEVGMMIQKATETTCDAQAAADLAAGVVFLQEEDDDDDAESDVEVKECDSGYGEGKTYEFGGNFGKLQQSMQSPVARAALQRMGKLSLGRDAYPAYSFLGMPLEIRAAARKLKMGEDPVEEENVVFEPAEPVKPGMGVPVDPVPKCATGKPNCPRLLDAVSVMVGEILDQLTAERNSIAKTTFNCEQQSANLKGQIDTWTETGSSAEFAFSQATADENTAAQELSAKQQEWEELNAALLDKQAECLEKKTAATNTLCGIKVIRLEVYQQESGEDNSWIPLIKDCEVGDWVDQECSVSCGGGIQKITRDIIDVAAPEDGPGAACPPTLIEQACENGPNDVCPVDCVHSVWSEWGACSNDCGGGLKSRERGVTQEPSSDGLPCEETSQTEACNNGACDVDCILQPEWGPYEPCSKACNTGITIRRKGVMTEAENNGKCESENDPKRFEYMTCNTGLCPPNLVCNSPVDVVFVLDASGSVEKGGFADTKVFTEQMIERMNFGETKAKAGVIKFSKVTTVVDQMTFDPEELVADVSSMRFDRSSTSTSKAIADAANVLMAGGRMEVSKEKSVVMVITDGVPADSKATGEISEKFKEKGRLVFAAVGSNCDENNLMKWATFPPEVNVLHAKKYSALPSQTSSFLADICPDLQCREEYGEADMTDYIGCQSQTVSGKSCQKWTDQSPNEHEYKKITKGKKKGQWPKEALKGNLLGGHNYCRNPDGDPDGIWCYTTGGGAEEGQQWELCAPRVNTTSWEPLVNPVF